MERRPACIRMLRPTTAMMYTRSTFVLKSSKSPVEYAQRRVTGHVTAFDTALIIPAITVGPVASSAVITAKPNQVVRRGPAKVSGSVLTAREPFLYPTIHLVEARARRGGWRRRPALDRRRRLRTQRKLRRCREPHPA